MIRYLLGVDIGTYSSKGVLVRQDGEVIGSHIVEHSLSLPKPGWAEHDPELVWWKDFLQIVQALLDNSHIAPALIGALGISTISPAVVALGGDGRALRPAILYGIDTRSTKEVDELEQLTGANLSSQSGAPKILWLRRNEPAVWRQTQQIVNGSGYLNLKLTGQATIDIYDAYAFNPFFNTQTLGWDAALADQLAPVEWMPRPTWTSEIAGLVTEEAARETGLRAGTPVITGTADAAAEAISVGLSKIGDMMIMYGSSTFFILKTDKFISSSHFWASPFLEPGTFSVAGGTATAGSLTRWFRDQFCFPELEAQRAGGENAYSILARQAVGSPPGSNGLVALPYFYGERTPIHDPQARGLIFGLTLNHTRADIYRALLESVGYAIRHNLEIMKAEGMQPARLLAVGGGTLNQPWMEIVCDIAGITQVIPAQQIGACYGDAFLAGIGVGLFSSTSEISRWLSSGQTLNPDDERHSRYEPYYQLYRDLYEQNVSAMHRISTLNK
jgi:xylulokinase